MVKPKGRKLADYGARFLHEAMGVARGPTRAISGGIEVAGDLVRRQPVRDLYANTRVGMDSERALHEVMGWIERAQRADGGVAGWYGIFTGYAASYPETTGYIVPTVLAYAQDTGMERYEVAAARMVDWLLTLQFDNGAFPEGLGGPKAGPSVFNTGQILNGLAQYTQHGGARVREAAILAGDWLRSVQSASGVWERHTYLGVSHTYYTMVAWALVLLYRATQEERFADAARANLRWVVTQQRDDGWFDGLNLIGRLNHLHFVAYVIQGLVEAGGIVGETEAVDAGHKAAWKLLRMFETRKALPGGFGSGWGEARMDYACLTGTAQTACCWLALYRRTKDLRFLNAALKANESVKALVPWRGLGAFRGGVAGSRPIWGPYQPFRIVSWGNKFFADALLGELHATRALAGRA